ncbi:T-cell surface glycoprotein CD3 epsilon chain isoform X2 [Seriola dumerili]|uniref:T-cell surface glycoprotein CD3 epsilon chain isoform X2 n=1 Tax=Seriola dumerili TaxID=41447 RepID=UPI000BBE8DE1|nr:T-cell surface glycoprotein CD3 epsilon chain isoform X2 [Seriola dumerili]
MNIMGVQSVLSILLLLVATVKAEEVEFWREKFTMTCPGNGTWFKHSGDKTPAQSLAESTTYSIEYNSDNKGLYYCLFNVEDPDITTDSNTSPKKYYFYVKGKVCANCFELDATLFGLVIIVDVVGTVFVMIIIYTYNKRKSPGGPTHSSKAPARPGGQGPPVPPQDYEQLNPRTRSHDTYSIVNRTG